MKSKYFKIYELMHPDVINKYGEEKCWEFLDEKLLKTIDFIREKLNKPITINTWKAKGEYDDRGYRSNLYKTDAIYCSQHLHGRAVDFMVKGMTAQDVRTWLKTNQFLLPYKIWVEDGVSWVHIDVRNSEKPDKVYFFKV